MEDFDPTKLRDWKDLDSLYKHPDGGPSNARAAAEKYLDYCDNHPNPIYPSAGTLCDEENPNQDTSTENIINVKPPKVEEMPNA